MWENKVVRKEQPKEDKTKKQKKRPKLFRCLSLKDKRMPSKLKVAAIAFCLILAISCLIAGIISKFNFQKINVKGFSGELRNISSSTQRIAQDEIDKVVLLNTGAENKNASFVVREKKDGEYVYNLDKEINQGYASFYIDSEELQLSLRVQVQWGNGLFAEAPGGTPARVSCAEKDHNNYPDSPCIDAVSDTYLASADVFDNFNLLTTEKYGNLSRKNLSILREVLGSYLKNADAKLKRVLLQPRTILLNGNNLTATIILENNKIYQLALENTDKEITIILKSDNNELLRYDSGKIKAGARHYLLLRNYLPAEIELEDDTAIAIRFAGGEKLNVNVENCELEKDTEKAKKYINSWIDEQGFNSDDFEINIIKHCEK